MEWSEWGACTEPCGEGTNRRHRYCTPPRHGGRACQGSNTDVRACFLRPCPRTCLEFHCSTVGKEVLYSVVDPGIFALICYLDPPLQLPSNVIAIG